MRGDVAPAAAARVGVEQVFEAVQQPAPEPAVEGALYDLAIACQQRQQRGRVGARPVAAQVALCERDVAARHGVAEHAPVEHAKRGAGLAPAEVQGASVGQRDLERAVGDARQQSQHGSCGKGQLRVARRIARGQRARAFAQVEGGGIGTAHRLISSTGGTGLEKNGTRFAHTRAACQWMRSITPSVIHG